MASILRLFGKKPQSPSSSSSSSATSSSSSSSTTSSSSSSSSNSDLREGCRRCGGFDYGPGCANTTCFCNYAPPPSMPRVAHAKMKTKVKAKSTTAAASRMPATKSSSSSSSKSGATSTPTPVAVAPPSSNVAGDAAMIAPDSNPEQDPLSCDDNDSDDDTRGGNGNSNGGCHRCGGFDYGPGSEETTCFCDY